jgi:Flp pilus assembly protein TadG
MEFLAWKTKMKRSQEGQAIVEFCVIMPLLLILLVGMIEMGVLLYDKAVITNASREGARAGILNVNPKLDVAGIQSVVQNYCSGKLISFAGGSGLAVPVVTGYDPTPHTGDPLTVTVNYNYNFLLPFFARSSFSLQARTVMRYE